MKFVNSISNSYLSKNSILTIIAGIMLGGIILGFPYAAVFFIIGFIVLLKFVRDPLKALSILIILLPFTNTGLFSDPLVNLKGSQPFFLLALFVVITVTINYGQSLKMPKYSLVFSIWIVAILGICVIRSLPNIDIINQYWMMEGGKAGLSKLSYFLKAFVRPLIYFMPFIIIIKFCRKIHHRFM
jgi:hypothetical protein